MPKLKFFADVLLVHKYLWSVLNLIFFFVVRVGHCVPTENNARDTRKFISFVNMSVWDFSAAVSHLYVKNWYRGVLVRILNESLLGLIRQRYVLESVLFLLLEGLDLELTFKKYDANVLLANGKRKQCWSVLICVRNRDPLLSVLRKDLQCSKIYSRHIASRE